MLLKIFMISELNERHKQDHLVDEKKRCDDIMSFFKIRLMSLRDLTLTRKLINVKHDDCVSNKRTIHKTSRIHVCVDCDEINHSESFAYILILSIE